MSYDFDKHYNLMDTLENDLRCFMQNNMESWTACEKTLFLKRYWNQIAKNWKKASLLRIPRNCLSEWIGYFKNHRTFRVMKNLCYFKECNYSECRAKDKKLEVCKKCKSVYYCCREHQKRDWKLNHRKECKEFDERDICLTVRKNYDCYRMEPSDDRVRFVESPISSLSKAILSLA